MRSLWKPRYWLGLLSLSLVALISCPAHAQTAAYTITNTTAGDVLANPPFTLGSEFTANSNEYVTALGVFDSDQDGLTDSYPVGLFDSSGTLLASATVASGTTDPLVDQFRYISIAPVTLTAGQAYYIGALYTTSDDGVIFPGDATGFATDPGITFDDATYAQGGTLSAPTNVYDASPGYFGPNFLVSPVPESAALINMAAALLALALGGLFVKARRRRAIRT